MNPIEWAAVLPRRLLGERAWQFLPTRVIARLLFRAAFLEPPPHPACGRPLPQGEAIHLSPLPPGEGRARGRLPRHERALAQIRLRFAALGLWILFSIATGAHAQTSPDDELKAHLDLLHRKVNDPASDVTVRETVAMEMAATLDRAAQTAPTAEGRRARWGEAVAALDRFRAANPKHPLGRQIAVQGAL